MSRKTKFIADAPQGTHKGKTLFVNARIVDPESGYDKAGDLLVENGVIKDFGKLGSVAGAEKVDCKGKLLAPGLVDIHVHVREPGGEKKETFTTASRAAVAGGVTSIAVMPDTKPVTDNLATLEYVRSRVKEKALCNVSVFAGITRNLEGNEIVEIGSLREAGVVGITDAINPVMSSQVMRHAMLLAADCGMLVAQHAEDLYLTEGACINEGEVSARLGLRGMPNAAEAIIVERDLRILELVQKEYPEVRYHVLHVSTAEALDAIARAKDKGLNVTCATAPHYFTLTDEAVEDYRTFAKVNPPLRSEKDRKAVYKAIGSGLVDAITSDHTPEDAEAKRVTFADAAPGITGLESLLALSLAVYHNGDAKLRDVLAALTYKPADIIGSKAGRIKKGAAADLALIDLDAAWKIDPDAFLSKSHNSPFEDWAVKGKVVQTFVSGQLVYQQS